MVEENNSLDFRSLYEDGMRELLSADRRSRKETMIITAIGGYALASCYLIDSLELVPSDTSWEEEILYRIEYVHGRIKELKKIHLTRA